MNPQFKTNPLVEKLANSLAKLELGQRLTYAELNKATGLALNGKHRHILCGACNKALKEHKVVIGAVRGVGIKRLTDTEMMDIPTEATGRIRRASQKALRKVICSDESKLTDTEKRQRMAGISILGALRQFSSNAKKHLAYGKKMEGSLAQVELKQVLGLFEKTEA